MLACPQLLARAVAVPTYDAGSANMHAVHACTVLVGLTVNVYDSSVSRFRDWSKECTSRDDPWQTISHSATGVKIVDCKCSN